MQGTSEMENGHQTPTPPSGEAGPVHTRKRTEIMQQKIVEEFKVKSQQVHQDISQTREQTFKQIASSRTTPTSEAFEKIQGQFKGAAIEFEEAQKLKRQQQFDEVAGIRRRRATSLPFAVQPSNESQPKQDTDAAKTAIRNSGRKSVREIASTFQGASLPQTMESFLQAYVNQQSVHRRAGSNSWQTPTKGGKTGGDTHSGIDVQSVVGEMETMTVQQKAEIITRFVDIRRTHGLETSTVELDRLCKTLMMDTPQTAATLEHHDAVIPLPPRTPPSTPVINPETEHSTTGRPQNGLGIGGQGSIKHHEPQVEAAISSPQRPDQHFTPVLNLDSTIPSPLPASEFANTLPRVPSNPPLGNQQQAASQNTAERSGEGGCISSSGRHQNGTSLRTFSIQSAGTSHAVLEDEIEHHDHESQISASVDTTFGVQHTDGSTMSRSGSLDEHTSVTTTTVGAVIGESVRDSYDMESADASAVLVPDVAVRSAGAQRAEQPQSPDESATAQHKRFWCC